MPPQPRAAVGAVRKALFGCPGTVEEVRGGVADARHTTEAGELPVLAWMTQLGDTTGDTTDDKTGDTLQLRQGESSPVLADVDAVRATEVAVDKARGVEGLEREGELRRDAAHGARVDARDGLLQDTANSVSIESS